MVNILQGDCQKEEGSAAAAAAGGSDQQQPRLRHAGERIAVSLRTCRKVGRSQQRCEDEAPHGGCPNYPRVVGLAEACRGTYNGCTGCPILRRYQCIKMAGRAARVTHANRGGRSGRARLPANPLTVEGLGNPSKCER